METLSPSSDRDMKRDLSITTSAEIPYMHRVIAVFSRVVVIVDFSRALPNDFFQKGPVGLKFHFTTPNLREKHLSTYTLIEKYQISKSRDCPLPLLSDAHVHTTRLRVTDIKVYEILPQIISSTLYSACQI